jgi:hypothetical protein
MDALEFLRERKRLCNSYKNCDGCPFVKRLCSISDIMSDEDCERIIAIVEQWSKEHPVKTRQGVFLKQWPNCTIDNDGVVGMCPKSVDKDFICDVNRFAGCLNCRREFWMQEVE